MSLTIGLVTLLLAGFIYNPEYGATQPEPTAEDRELAAEIERLLAHPIDLNRATADDLLAIPWLEPSLAYRIVAARDAVGGLGNLDELLSVPGVTPGVRSSLARVLTLRCPSEPWHTEVTARAGADTVVVRGVPWRTGVRALVENGAWQAAAGLEKDAGESDFADAVALGLRYRSPGATVIAGDHVVDCGEGLVLASGRRGGNRVRSGFAGTDLRLVTSSPETRHMRGAAVGAGAGPWRIAGSFSHRRIDAVLRPDGTVDRLLGSGLHDDSAARAARGQLGEEARTVAVGCGSPRLGVTAAAQWLRFDRAFAPRESVESFSGRNLSVGAVAASGTVGSHSLGVEVARAGTGGSAVAVSLSGEWPALTLGARAAVRQRAYFAPHGRWAAMTSRSDRVDAAGRIRYDLGGFDVSVSANTYREYSDDSLPARVVLAVGHRSEPVMIDVMLARSFRGEQGRYRSSRLRSEVVIGNDLGLGLVLANEHREYGDGDGLMGALLARAGSDRMCFEAAVAGFRVDGTGVTMTLEEPSAGRVGASFSTSQSCWRTSAAVGVRPFRGCRVGVRAGCSWARSVVPDVSGQIEIGAGDD